jgi:hypothetical protein
MFRFPPLDAFRQVFFRQHSSATLVFFRPPIRIRVFLVFFFVQRAQTGNPLRSPLSSSHVSLSPWPQSPSSGRLCHRLEPPQRCRTPPTPYLLPLSPSPPRSTRTAPTCGAILPSVHRDAPLTSGQEKGSGARQSCRHVCLLRHCPTPPSRVADPPHSHARGRSLFSPGPFTQFLCTYPGPFIRNAA